MLSTIIKIPTMLLIVTVCSSSMHPLNGGSKEVQMREMISRAREPPVARCAFTVHEGGPRGPEIKDVTLEQELFYKVRCEPQKGYCLGVSNCTVRAAEEKAQRGGGGSAYPIIDERGCTAEPPLFQHVQYEDDFTAGIFNPYPIRLRRRSTGVQFQCVTSLKLLEMDGQCKRESCGTKGNSSAEERKNDERTVGKLAKI